MRLPPDGTPNPTNQGLVMTTRVVHSFVETFETFNRFMLYNQDVERLLVW